MANPSPTYDNIRRGGPEGLREPMEIQRATYEVYKEVDLGALGAGTYALTADQAGASLITVNPSAPITLVYPTNQPGFSAAIQNLSAVAGATVTVEVNGNAVNTAVIPISKMAYIIHTGLNGGIYLSSPAN